MVSFGLYIHLPFCKRKCNYCDFISYAGKEALIDDYVGAVVKEIQSSPLSFASQNSFPSPSKMERGVTNEVSDGVRTIYFGGGTPTLLEPKHFERILAPLIPLSISDGEGETRSEAEGGGEVQEITIESNPATADKAKLKALRQLGINRLSIGAQTFNDRHLKTLGRIHSAADIFRFFEDARSAGFDNINLDLIFALPGQTLDEWKNDLQTALSLSPEHLSTYNLQIEEGTYLYDVITKNQVTNPKQFRNYKFKIPNEETELEMYEYTIDTLTAAGFKHYEISNFAKPGFECRHNINYWRNGNYIGLGAGAHSHTNGKRWANSNSIETYLGNRDLPVRQAGVQSQVSPSSDTIFLGLRLLDGLEVDAFNGFEKEVSELIEDGLLMRENNHYKLTRRGLYLGNIVFERFI